MAGFKAFPHSSQEYKGSYSWPELIDSNCLLLLVTSLVLGGDLSGPRSPTLLGSISKSNPNLGCRELLTWSSSQTYWGQERDLWVGNEQIKCPLRLLPVAREKEQQEELERYKIVPLIKKLSPLFHPTCRNKQALLKQS